MTKKPAQLDAEIASIIAGDADLEGRHAVADLIRKEAGGLPLRPSDIAARASRDPAEWPAIFDRLKPGQIVYLAITSVMGASRAESGAYVAHKVGRRSKARRPQWWVESISLLPADGSKPHPFAQYKLTKRKSGEISASSGDMAVFLEGMYAPP